MRIGCSILLLALAFALPAAAKPPGCPAPAGMLGASFRLLHEPRVQYIDEQGPRFPIFVARSGEWLVIADGGPAPARRDLQIHRRGASGWQFHQRLPLPTLTMSSQPVKAAAMDADTLVVGDVLRNVDVFVREGDLWRHASSFTRDDGFVGTG